MSKPLKTVIALAIFATLGSASYADSKHHNDGDTTAAAGTEADLVNGGAVQTSMMNGSQHKMMHSMMQTMMQMHSSENGPLIGQMHLTDRTAAGPTGMMDQDMMYLMRASMMGQFDADADGDGAVSNEEAHGTLQSMHSKADTNGDGLLSLDEFNPLHAEMTRGLMVDRFQHLDTDGDGKVTAGEMTAPADRMQMRSQGETTDH